MVLTLDNQDEQKRQAKKELMCPKCKSAIQTSDRVPRGWFVKNFLFWLSLKRYKCYRCNKKYYFNH